ncbi:ethanolamine kinase 1-like [Ornithodoros turicata]|uniref:ethanolamine kinase 1-like n=1 Tax=Ornithodoros turicata TaxID=34597 RepID=UPI00313895A7
MLPLINGTGEPDKLTMVDVFIDAGSEQTLKEGALKVLNVARPHWSAKSIRYKLFTDGLTNTLLGCWDEDDEEGVLLRIYGRNTELIINRSAEVVSMQLLHEHNLAAPLHCAFRNGLCYGYNPGRVGDVDLVREPHVSKLIAQTLARMHSVALYCEGPNIEPSLFPTMHKYLSLMPTEFADLKKNTRFLKCIPNKSELEQEVKLLEDHLSQLGSPVVFCHNDLLLKNFIYQEKEDKVIFIDFEYANNNFQALDIGNHFCEFCGVDGFDSSLYPGREFQLKWLWHYLEEWYTLTGKGPTVTDLDVELLYVQINKFSLASCMFWCLWALIQAAHSTIKFDFLQFAVERLTMYNEKKQEFMDLSVPKSQGNSSNAGFLPISSCNVHK